jgi:hypothetical protein
VPQCYVVDNHPAIIDKDLWEAVQLEMERRRAYVLEHGIQKLEYATILPDGGNAALAAMFLAGKYGTLLNLYTIPK